MRFMILLKGDEHTEADDFGDEMTPELREREEQPRRRSAARN
jgi:hypothetical protein